MHNIIVFGAPCSGKGKQGKKVAQTFNLIHISPGEILREEIKRDSPLGQLTRTYIEKGELVPDNIIFEDIILKVLNQTERHGFVFDGFPRTLAQAQKLDNILAQNNNNVKMVIHIDVEEQELMKRMRRRSRRRNRIDDSLSILNNRIYVYNNITLPVLDYYKQLNKLHRISGMAPQETVFAQIAQLVEEVIKQ